jgi:hypothetical protein
MMISYLKKRYVGAYSKISYAPAGAQVTIIGRHDNMVLVLYNENKFFIPDNLLTNDKTLIEHEPIIDSKKKTGRSNRR